MAWVLDGAGAASAGADFLQACEIIPENLAFKDAVLQAGEVGCQLRAGLGGQCVHPPGAADFDFHHPVPAQVGELLGGPHRPDAEHLLKVAHTLRPNPQQIENPQPFHVAKTLVDRDDLRRIVVRDSHDGGYLSPALTKRK